MLQAWGEDPLLRCNAIRHVCFIIETTWIPLKASAYAQVYFNKPTDLMMWKGVNRTRREATTLEHSLRVGGTSLHATTR